MPDQNNNDSTNSNQRSGLFSLNINIDSFKTIATRELKEAYLNFKLALAEVYVLSKASSMNDDALAKFLQTINENFAESKAELLADHKDTHSPASVSLHKFELYQILQKDTGLQAYIDDSRESLVAAIPSLPNDFKLTAGTLPIKTKTEGVEPGFNGYDVFDILLQVYRMHENAENPNEVRWKFIKNHHGNLAEIFKAVKADLNEQMVKGDYDKKAGILVADKKYLRNSNTIKKLSKKSSILGETSVAFYQVGKATTADNKNIENFLEATANDIARALGAKTQKQYVLIENHEDGDLKVMLKSEIAKDVKSLQPIKGPETQGYRVYPEVHTYRRLRATPDYISDNRIPHFAQYFFIMAVLGDIDGIGSMGQNKGILNNDFFVYDCGKAFKGIFELYNNFHLKNDYKNYSIFYDYPRSDFVRGVICVAKVAGIELNPEILKSYGEDFVSHVNQLKPKADIKVFDDKINTFIRLKEKYPKYSASCDFYIKYYETTKAEYVERRDKLIKQFEHYLYIEKDVIDLCETLEKILVIDKVKGSVLTHDRVVQVTFNRLQIPPEALTSKIIRNSKGVYTLRVEFTSKNDMELACKHFKDWNDINPDSNNIACFPGNNVVEIKFLKKAIPYLTPIFNEDNLQDSTITGSVESIFQFQKFELQKKIQHILLLFKINIEFNDVFDISARKGSLLDEIQQICFGQTGGNFKLTKNNIQEIIFRVNAITVALEGKKSLDDLSCPSFKKILEIHTDTLANNFQLLFNQLEHAIDANEYRDNVKKTVEKILNSDSPQDHIQKLRDLADQAYPNNFLPHQIRKLFADCEVGLKIILDYEQLLVKPIAPVIKDKGKEKGSSHPASEIKTLVEPKNKQPIIEPVPNLRVEPDSYFETLEIDRKEFFKLATKKQRVEYLTFKLMLLEMHHTYNFQAKESIISSNLQMASSLDNTIKKLNNAYESLLKCDLLDSSDEVSSNMHEQAHGNVSLLLHDHHLRQLILTDLKNLVLNNEKDHPKIRFNKNDRSLIMLNVNKNKDYCSDSVHDVKDVFLYIYHHFPNLAERQEFLKKYHADFDIIYFYLADDNKLPKYLLKHLDVKNFIFDEDSQENTFGFFNKLISSTVNHAKNNKQVIFRAIANSLAKAYGLPLASEYLYSSLNPSSFQLRIKTAENYSVTGKNIRRLGFAAKEIVCSNNDDINYLSYQHEQLNLAKYFMPLLILGDLEALNNFAQEDCKSNFLITFNQAFEAQIHLNRWFQADQKGKICAAFYDAPRSDFVRGLIIIAKMAGYTLRPEVLASYGDDFKNEVDRIIPFSDNTHFDDVIDFLLKYKVKFQSKLVQSEAIQRIIDDLLDAKNNSDKTKLKLLDQFKYLLSIKKEVIDLCENIEKVMVSSENTSLRVDDVLLNHLQITNGAEKCDIQYYDEKYHFILSYPNTYSGRFDRTHAFGELKNWMKINNTTNSPLLEAGLSNSSIIIKFTESNVPILSFIFNENSIIKSQHKAEYDLLKRAHYEQEIMNILNKIDLRLTQRTAKYLINLNHAEPNISIIMLRIFNDIKFVNRNNKNIFFQINHIEKALNLLKQAEPELLANINKDENRKQLSDDDVDNRFVDESIKFIELSKTSTRRISLNELKSQQKFLTIIKRFVELLPREAKYFAPIFALQALTHHATFKINQSLLSQLDSFELDNAQNFVLSNNETDQIILENMLHHLFYRTIEFDREQVLPGSRLDFSVGLKYLAKPACRIEILALTNGLSKNESNELWSAFKNNKSVTTLDLSNGQLNNDITGLVEALIENKHLKVLKLVNCGLDDDALLKIINLLENNFVIIDIDLSQNPKITNLHFEHLLDVLNRRGTKYLSPEIHLDRNLAINIYWRQKINDLNVNKNPDAVESVALIERLAENELIQALPKETILSLWDETHSKENCEMISSEINLLQREKEQLAITQHQDITQLDNIDPSIQNQIAVLDARLALLEAEHAVKVDIHETIALLKTYQPPVLEFYKFLYINLENIFLAAKSISSGLLHSAESTSQAKINQTAETGLTLAGGLFSMIPVIGPIVGSVTKAVGSAAVETSKAVNQVRCDEGVKKFGNLITVSDVQKIAHEIAKSITFNYLEQINRLHTKAQVHADRDGKKEKLKDKMLAWADKTFDKSKKIILDQDSYSDAERLALLVLDRICTSLQSDQLNKNDALAPQIVAEVAKEPTITEKFIHEFYNFLGTESIEYLNWLYKDILLLPGVKIKTAKGYEYYSSAELNPEKYGFRESTMDEVKRLGLTKYQHNNDKDDNNNNKNDSEQKLKIIPKPASKPNPNDLLHVRSQLLAVHAMVATLQKENRNDKRILELQESVVTLSAGFNQILIEHVYMKQQLDLIMKHLNITSDSDYSSLEELPSVRQLSEGNSSTSANPDTTLSLRRLSVFSIEPSSSGASDSLKSDGKKILRATHSG